VKNDQTAKNEKHSKETLPARRADNYLPAPQTACTATNQKQTNKRNHIANGKLYTKTENRKPKTTKPDATPPTANAAAIKNHAATGRAQT